MNLKVKIRKALRETYGEYETYLEQSYENIIIENLINGNKEKKKNWVTYNQVILELKHSLKDQLLVKELQYKLTDKLDPAEVCIEVLKNVQKMTPELERLYYKISNF